MERGLERFETVLELLEHRAHATPDAVAYVSPDRSETTWLRFAEAAMALGRLLAARGVVDGTRVAILMPTSLAWEVAHFAVLAAGGVVVGLDPRSDARALTDSVEQVDVTAVLVDDLGRLAELASSARRRVRVVACVSRAPLTLSSWALHTRKPNGELWPAAAVPPVSELPRATGASLATIVFTSGSMGRPKALGYTHTQLLEAVMSVVKVFPGVGPGNNLIAWLPLSSLFQRMIDLAALRVGATTYFVDDPRGVIACAREVSPELFFGVPRFFQELRRTILARASRPSRWIIQLTLVAARARGAASRTGRSALVARATLRVLGGVAARLRTVLGENLRAIVVGSAPMPIALVDELEGLGLPVLEAYGMSECILPIAMNALSARRAGTVGRVLDGQTLRVATDGELEVKCASLAIGIGHDLALTDDGFLRTGDLGAVDADGYVTLLGRKDGVVKLANGRKLDPAIVEQAFFEIPWVDQVQVVGHGLSRPAAIVWLRGESAVDARAVRDELRQTARSLPSGLRPSRYAIIPRPASVDDDEITPTMKPRRAANAARYAPYLCRKGEADDTMEEIAWLPVIS